jgi:hypothetical protein
LPLVLAHAVEQARVDGSHAWPAGQSAGPLQPQVCITHAAPFALDAQLAHIPVAPQLAGSVPATQLAPSQQPLLHSWLAEQREVQERAVVSHAFCDGQSPALAQPQRPPPVAARQALPALALAHGVQATPPEPQLAGSVPATQLAPSQQPPLQVWPPAHEVEHWCELVSHAEPTGQSAEVMQPHCCVAMHTWPVAALVQSLQLAPGAPHAVVALPPLQVPPLQQAPLHGWLVEQPVVHAPAAVSHAEPAGQSPVPAQPHAPPPPTAPHTAPMLEVVQSTHAPPAAPHAFEAVPPTQLPPEQQPPLHALVGPHAIAQVCALGSHALPTAQSLAVVQPQLPPRH